MKFIAVIPFGSCFAELTDGHLFEFLDFGVVHGRLSHPEAGVCLDPDEHLAIWSKEWAGETFSSSLAEIDRHGFPGGRLKLPAHFVFFDVNSLCFCPSK